MKKRRWKVKQSTDSTWWINQGEYRWMVYESLARQVQVKVKKRSRINKPIEQAEVDGVLRYGKIVQFINAGYSQAQIKNYIDSVYYGR